MYQSQNQKKKKQNINTNLTSHKGTLIIDHAQFHHVLRPRVSTEVAHRALCVAQPKANHHGSHYCAMASLVHIDPSIQLMEIAAVKLAKVTALNGLVYLQHHGSRVALKSWYTKFEFEMQKE